MIILHFFAGGENGGVYISADIVKIDDDFFKYYNKIGTILSKI
jgi:hypothetical protein